MKSSILIGLSFGGAALSAFSGFDISHYQSTPYNFDGAYSSGARFVIIKATEGTTYKDPAFSSHYTGATDAGFIRGAYHFAHLDSSSGAAQAEFFLENGGGWSGDGITLPGMLDLEGDCVLSASASVSCTGDSSAFVDTNPLALARYSSSAGTPPGGWPYYTIWQFNDAYEYGGDSDTFNGDQSGLERLATG
ncbi:hypothetical protein DL764_010363 [Monosporascus ibericus]|uniref:Lysozyme n=1 Tax=Monosporascus ibericus TaxID=155417 RepID=A0A4Q4SSU5_9PEZI|nr:hypothetical protein DL764_010363 [Monosporascus ibericus]